jgi:hypothetical protein
MVRFGQGLEITPWHPIKCSDGVWRFPCEVGAVQWLECIAVYSLVLEADSNVALNNTGSNSDSGVVIGDIECATLGHGMVDDARRVETREWSGRTNVIWHEYFGSSKVVQDLAKLPGWSEGRIVFAAGCMERDEETGCLVSFKCEAAVQEILSF